MNRWIVVVWWHFILSSDASRIYGIRVQEDCPKFSIAMTMKQRRSKLAKWKVQPLDVFRLVGADWLWLIKLIWFLSKGRKSRKGDSKGDTRRLQALLNYVSNFRLNSGFNENNELGFRLVYLFEKQEIFEFKFSYSSLWHFLKWLHTPICTCKFDCVVHMKTHKRRLILRRNFHRQMFPVTITVSYFQTMKK